MAGQFDACPSASTAPALAENPWWSDVVASLIVKAAEDMPAKWKSAHQHHTLQPSGDRMPTFTPRDGAQIYWMH
jgi:hypothetical protein